MAFFAWPLTVKLTRTIECECFFFLHINGTFFPHKTGLEIQSQIRTLIYGAAWANFVGVKRSRLSEDELHYITKTDENLDKVKIGLMLEHRDFLKRKYKPNRHTLFTLKRDKFLSIPVTDRARMNRNVYFVMKFGA